MDIFKNRMVETINKKRPVQNQDEFKALSDHDKVRFNCKWSMNERRGDFLIKVGKNNERCYLGEGNKYIDFTYTGDGWFALGPRREAQWFSGKEAFEVLSKLKKGFTIVRRNH